MTKAPGPGAASSGGPPAPSSAQAPVAPVPAASVPPEVQVILQHLPPEQRRVVEQSFSLLYQYQGPGVNPVLSKIDGEHVHKILEGIENDNQRMYQDRDRGRSHNRFLAIVGVAGFLLVSGLFLWAQQSNLLKDVLTWLAIFVGGLGVGFLRRKAPR